METSFSPTNWPLNFLNQESLKHRRARPKTKLYSKAKEEDAIQTLKKIMIDMLLSFENDIYSKPLYFYVLSKDQILL